jgi:hypothetical protein
MLGKGAEVYFGYTAVMLSHYRILNIYFAWTFCLHGVVKDTNASCMSALLDGLNNP